MNVRRMVKLSHCRYLKIELRMKTGEIERLGDKDVKNIHELCRCIDLQCVHNIWNRDFSYEMKLLSSFLSINSGLCL